MLQRFKLIIDLTFRRYMELQKSEANAHEACRIKAAAMDELGLKVHFCGDVNLIKKRTNITDVTDSIKGKLKKPKLIRLFKYWFVCAWRVL